MPNEETLRSLRTAWQKLRANRGIIAFPERGWEDWEEVDKLVRALEPDTEGTR